jgi:hypothetical protein
LDGSRRAQIYARLKMWMSAECRPITDGELVVELDREVGAAEDADHWAAKFVAVHGLVASLGAALGDLGRR